MSTARRQARARLASSSADVLPEPIRAGACVEVWCPEHAPGLCLHAWHSWVAAVSPMRAGHRWDELPAALRQSPRPWSYAAALADGTLADELAVRGLPSDWAPEGWVPP